MEISDSLSVLSPTSAAVSDAALPPLPASSPVNGEDTFVLEEGEPPPSEQLRSVVDNRDDANWQVLPPIPPEVVFNYIKDLSEGLNDSRQLSVDTQLLDSIVKQAGEFFYGISLVEVYAFDGLRLTPVGSWFSDDATSKLHHDTVLSETEKDLILSPEQCVTGVDLVGTLWSRQQPTTAVVLKAKAIWHSFTTRRSGRERVARLPPLPSGATDPLSTLQARPHLHALRWTYLQSIIEDTDKLHGPRVEALKSAGFERATGIVFRALGDNQGIVIFYSKSDVDLQLISAVPYEAYMCRATELIGSVLAMSETRRASVEFLRQRQNETEIAFPRPQGASLNEENPFTSTKCMQRAERSVMAWFNKCWGGGSEIPPPMSVTETLFTMLGSFVGLTLMLVLNATVRLLSDEEYLLVIGPFGALMMLQYGLSGSPAAQPRNVVFGVVVAGFISMIFTYIPETVLPTWLRLTLATSVAIGAMVKLGIPNPPASALCLIYAKGEHNWVIYGVSVLCSIISLIPATMINNMSRVRQYPTYWGFVPKYAVRLYREKYVDENVGRSSRPRYD